MRNSFFKIYILLTVISCQGPMVITCQSDAGYTITNEQNTLNGAERYDEYLPLLKDKKVALVANHTSMIDSIHLVDELISRKVKLVKVFAPEHGFRGIADAGKKINTETDLKTGLPIISLYGKNKKPSPEQLSDVDVVLFDIQDVGVRFYTYISTMTYVMEACAENGKQLIILDRPNPNGHYVDGPVLQNDFKSFVGMHPVPIVHGMTVGEYAEMVNGEKWLPNGIQCRLQVVTVKDYTHKTLYQVPIAPSPNLKTMVAIYCYPTTCLFEGTALSVGRGTDDPFTMVGHPSLKGMEFIFIPKSMPGAKEPKFENQTCYGINFRTKIDASTIPPTRIYIEWLVNIYDKFDDKEHFFNDFFKLLAGNNSLANSIKNKTEASVIQNGWQHEVEGFKKIRKKYLLYPDFE